MRVRLSLQTFLERANKLHGDKFNYQLVELSTVKINTKIICNTCTSIFEQTPDAHLRGHGCPYCAGQKVNHTNCIRDNDSRLMRDWDFSKNILLPSEVSRGCSKSVWWKCEKGHGWQATPNTRNNCGNNCPYCANQLVCEDNSLAALNPIIAQELHPTKNKLNSTQIIYGSNHYFWWVCNECDFEWRASLDKRKNGRNCPSCANNYSLHGNYFSSKNDKNIKYDSSWELEVMQMYDSQKDIIKWDRCKDVLCYFDTSMNKYRKYYPDFQILKNNGKVIIEEIKALRKDKMLSNLCKFKSASVFYASQGKEYKVLTRAKRWIPNNYIEFDFNKELEKYEITRA